jgi:hypothetical protein
MRVKIGKIGGLRGLAGQNFVKIFCPEAKKFQYQKDIQENPALERRVF